MKSARETLQIPQLKQQEAHAELSVQKASAVRKFPLNLGDQIKLTSCNTCEPWHSKGCCIAAAGRCLSTRLDGYFPG